MKGIAFRNNSTSATTSTTWTQYDDPHEVLKLFLKDVDYKWLSIKRDDEHLFQSLLPYRGKLWYIMQHGDVVLYRIFSEEEMYLKLANEILTHGNVRNDRTGTGVFSLFGRHLRFDLTDGRLPLLTSKRMFFKGIAKELFWFLKGCTDATKLSEDGIHIWDANGSRETLDKLGLTHYKEGELGPVYGYQWRFWGKPYSNNTTDERGIDQIKSIIQTIRTNPYDRRMILSAWNVSELRKMALPPCHLLSQFYVDENNGLSCSMYQRSADVFLGVPFNIASYALLTHLIAHVTGCFAKELIMNFGDVHVYKNHKHAIQEQLKRCTYAFPKLKIHNSTNDIDQIKYEDLEVIDYKSNGTIKAPMAI